jgi:hypothetical protein
MTSKKLGALLRSVPPATVSAEHAPAPESIPEPPPRPSPRAAAAMEREVPLQVLIPERIRKRLAVKAAEEGQSLRALILRAIRGLGIEVTEADIKGKRGRKEPMNSRIANLVNSCEDEGPPGGTAGRFPDDPGVQ